VKIQTEMTETGRAPSEYRAGKGDTNPREDGCVLTVAGHDLSNGAGITKDLEVFSSLGLRGLSVPTCFVVQGPDGVSGVTPVADEIFGRMLDRVSADFPLKGVKIGVVPDGNHGALLADFLHRHQGIFVVLDPVIAAKNGMRLINEDGMEVLEERLLPLATCITPNLDEAEELLGRSIDNLESMEKAAKALRKRGAANVVIKGGHLAGEPVDLLFDGQAVHTFSRKRVGKTVHGTGCLFSSALLSFLVLGYPIREAVALTGRNMEEWIKGSAQFLEKGYYYAFPALAVPEKRPPTNGGKT
jgi:hydroxymethylpyrimidine kinase/phosphomethylpyrimidine kinase